MKRPRPEQLPQRLDQDHIDRLARLGPMCEYGPDYNRFVREYRADAIRFLHSNHESTRVHLGERFLLKCEMHAGFITFDEFQAACAALEGRLAV